MLLQLDERFVVSFFGDQPANARHSIHMLEPLGNPALERAGETNARNLIGFGRCVMAQDDRNDVLLQSPDEGLPGSLVRWQDTVPRWCRR